MMSRDDRVVTLAGTPCAGESCGPWICDVKWLGRSDDLGARSFEDIDAALAWGRALASVVIVSDRSGLWSAGDRPHPHRPDMPVLRRQGPRDTAALRDSLAQAAKDGKVLDAGGTLWDADGRWTTYIPEFGSD